MRKIFFSAWLLFFGLVLTGMGDLGGKPEGAIPEPEENFAVQLLDRDDVSVALNRFSLDGKVLMSGQRGRGTFNVPFSQIQTVVFGTAEGKQVPAELQLKSGETVKLQLRKGSYFYGHTGYGSFRIRALDIQRIDFE